jgi:hypothetical protein
MRKIKTNIYKFEELTVQAQQKAIENLRDINTNHDWYDDIFEDATTIGRLFGLDIEKIYFSGFWSQGDGASFEGDYCYKKGGLKAVKEYAPQDTELHDIVKALQNEQSINFYKSTANIRQQGRYYHENTMYIDIENGNEDCFSNLLRDYARWIYKKLESGYDYLTSEQAILETIQANDYEFTENGNLV